MDKLIAILKYGLVAVGIIIELGVVASFILPDNQNLQIFAHRLGTFGLFAVFVAYTIELASQNKKLRSQIQKGQK